MQNVGGGGGVAAAPKRMRRPSVRLHQPYYENPPGHRKLQQQWKAITKKPRTVENVHSKDNKNGGVSESSKGDEMEDFDLDDDVAIGNWKNFKVRDGNFKSKRVRSSTSKKRVSGKSWKNEDLEMEDLSLSSGEHEEKEQEEEEQENNSGANGTNSNSVIRNFNPNCSFGDGDGDGNDKLSDGNDNVGRKQRGLSNFRHSNEMVRDREGDRDRHGVTAWLNKMGLGKYAPLFEIHGVDDEVLPLLTLEDLKDMGINEVGPRRKMYSSIQKLNNRVQ